LEKVRHNRLRDLLHSLFTAAGYTSARERLVPEWTQLRRDRLGRATAVQARLDLVLNHPPDDPVIYGDVVIGHPLAQLHCRAAAQEDGATARLKEAGKHRRYPDTRLHRGRLVVLAAETYGRWGREARQLFKTAAERAGQRRPELRQLGRNATATVSGRYAALLSCTLQKTNVRMLNVSLGDGPHHLTSASHPDVDTVVGLAAQELRRNGWRTLGPTSML
jgi:hypothetical protein